MSKKKFDYYIGIVKNRSKTKDLKQKWELLNWVSIYIIESGVNATWVTRKVDIKKLSLHFA